MRNDDDDEGEPKRHRDGERERESEVVHPGTGLQEVGLYSRGLLLKRVPS